MRPVRYGDRTRDRPELKEHTGVTDIWVSDYSSRSQRRDGRRPVSDADLSRTVAHREDEDGDGAGTRQRAGHGPKWTARRRWSTAAEDRRAATGGRHRGIPTAAGGADDAAGTAIPGCNNTAESTPTRSSAPRPISGELRARRVAGRRLGSAYSTGGSISVSSCWQCSAQYWPSSRCCLRLRRLPGYPCWLPWASLLFWLP